MGGSVNQVSLFRGFLRFYQPKSFKVSITQVVFIKRVKVKGGEKVGDFGAGFGFLSLYLAKKYSVKVYAYEKDPLMFGLLKENIKLNSLEGKVIPINEDIRNIKEKFDKVVSNPPFYNFQGPNPYTFEGNITLKELIEVAESSLRDYGDLYLILPAFRLYECFHYFKRLKPKQIFPLYPKRGKPCRYVIVRAKNNAKSPNLTLEEPLYLNEAQPLANSP